MAPSLYLVRVFAPKLADICHLKAFFFYSCYFIDASCIVEPHPTKKLTIGEASGKIMAQ
jgi:hypothetical protein